MEDTIHAVNPDETPAQTQHTELSEDHLEADASKQKGLSNVKQLSSAGALSKSTIKSAAQTAKDSVKQRVTKAAENENLGPAGHAERESEIKDSAVGQGQEDRDEGDGPIKTVGSDFFDEFELTPMPKKYFNLTPDLHDPGMKFLKNDMGFNSAEIDMTQLLAADHPLLDKFQKSLKEQLLKKVYSMREQVADLVEGCKIKRTEKETLGNEAFETQQTSSKQEQCLRSCLKDLENVTGAREELDFQLAQASEEFEYEKADNVDAESEEIAIRAEMESVDMLTKQMTNWEAEIESEMMISQRVIDHTARTKVDLYQQQKQLDVILYNMMKEVWRLESEIEKAQMQIRVKEEERERLAEAVALANIDIEANQTEYRCLVHGWQSVLVTINQRDKYHITLQAEFTKLDDIMTSVNSELLHIKKEIHKEHLENERLTLFKDRLDYELKNIAKALQVETDKRDGYLKIVAQYDRFIDENNKQREILKAEIAAAKEEETCLSREMEGLNQAKYQLEQDVLIHLQSNAFNSDACRQMANVLKDCKEDNRRMRINIARVEGQISNTHAEYQYLRMENGEVTEQLRELKITMTQEDEELMNINKDFCKCEKLLGKNILLYEQLKLKATGDAAEKVEMWPEEIKIRQLEATNGELIEKNKQAQSFWLREQAIVVELSEKRQGQMKEMDLLKKQICVMDQKNLRINDTLEGLNNLEDALTKNINGYENKMNFYTSGLHKKRNSKTALNVANQKVQNELQNKLEEGEFESLRLKAEIVEIEEDKYATSRELIDKNREALCWEKKLLMVLDTRKQMFESHSESGELAQMRTEIHRMNVRYSQLKKAQDKLIHDLDNCIFRRDSIVTLAEARTRGHKGGSQQWRVNFNKRRDDLKNKITQADQELACATKQMETKILEMEKGSADLKSTEEQIITLKKVTAEVGERVEQAKITRQLRLDVLLYKQRKLKTYIELSRGRSPYMLYKSQTMAHNAYTKERTLNTKLRLIVEDMQTDMPQHMNFLTKCHNSLVLPAVKL